ncbi:GTP pyrophosphokinase [Budvicia aquatica]|uniref:GTP pyrophosphokinase n=1 Tax=Budvicia aquatica TaxID=82979 RepID=UPI002087F5F6|nr:RelA/SpoT domain-containing protein [Budvicia aquatica]GKX50623.1 hypothetical protein SOASR029_09320 [Budvicia aquatica]
MEKKNVDAWLDNNLSKFELLGKHVAFIIETLLQQNNIDYLSVGYRTKSKQGVLEKIERKEYKNPIEDLTDISGIRIILYFETDIDKVCNIISSTFNIDKKNSMDNSNRLSTDKVGYRSVHYVCDIGEGRKELSEYEFISNLKCEIQVRTVLQHAWAELTHDRNYKLGAKLPDHIQRKINLYSGMLEIADLGFAEIINEINQYSDSLSHKGLQEFTAQAIDSINLLAYVNEICKQKGLILKPNDTWDSSITSELINELEHMGIKSLDEIGEIIPENYVEISNNQTSNNIYGFIRDMMLIKDYKLLYSIPKLNWAISDNRDPEDIQKNIEFYSNFMPEPEAKKLVEMFSV